MIALVLAATFLIQSSPSQSPPSTDPDQANAQAALEGMERIFTTMGACERHFTPEQIRGVRRGFEPAPGQGPSPLQAYIAAAYERGKADTTWSAPACREVMRALAEAKARPGQ